MGTSSGAVSRTGREKSPENDQSPHRRWGQLCRNKISNTDKKFWQARSAKWNHCKKCFWLAKRLSDSVQNKRKTNMCATNEPYDDREMWHYSYVKRVSALLPNKLSGRKAFLFAVPVKIYDRRNCGKAEQVCRGINSKPTPNRNAQGRWKFGLLPKLQQIAKCAIRQLRRFWSDCGKNATPRTKQARELHRKYKPPRCMWMCVQGGEERRWSIRHRTLPRRECRGGVSEGDFARERENKKDLRTIVPIVMPEKRLVWF